jgi:hypothetical protein
MERDSEKGGKKENDRIRRVIRGDETLFGAGFEGSKKVNIMKVALRGNPTKGLASTADTKHEHHLRLHVPILIRLL